jgi:membrane protein implicated in regulation of membrane protease activity
MRGLLDMSAFTVFLAIGSIGFLFLLLSFVVGEVSDLLGGIDVDHDHDVAHAGDHGAGPSPFSTRVMAMFLTAFGACGAIATHYGLSPLPASAVGMVSGTFFGSIVYVFARFLHGQQASSQVKAAEFIGQTARVIVAIPANGLGQVRCRIGEELVDRIARTADGAAIASNAMVRIEDVVGETVIVAPA